MAKKKSDPKSKLVITIHDAGIALLVAKYLNQCLKVGIGSWEVTEESGQFSASGNPAHGYDVNFSKEVRESEINRLNGMCFSYLIMIGYLTKKEA